MSTERRHTIVCLSSQAWQGLWTNKQHIMSRLARSHRVIHVDFGTHHLLKAPARRFSKSKSSVLPHRLVLEPHVSDEHGVTVLEFFLPHALLQALPKAGELRARYLFDYRTRLLQHWLDANDIRDPIVWVYHPGYGPAAIRMPRKLLVYDCVDEYAAFPQFKAMADVIRERERLLCQSADVVFTTSRALFEAKRVYNPDATYLVPNVGDAEHFSRALAPELEVPAELAALPKPRVVFVGAVSDYKLNLEWLDALAARRPDWSVVLIGPVGLGDPTTDVQRLLERRNVRMLGERPYATLPAYLKGADVTVIPYRINPYTAGVFPIKFFEFMATGKPVVISDLPALSDYFDVVRVARTAGEFVEQCEQAVTEPDVTRARRLELADEHSWPARVRQLMQHIEQRL
jgi:glycosyltransferase involved in cell wall biosynthesis